jgi:hypothetical protein
MKLLGNPWIVSGLCVIAAGLAAYQILAPQRSRGTAAAPNSSALVPASSPASPAPGALPQKASEPGRVAARTPPATLIDLTYVQSHLAQWLESPLRDPFLLSSAGKPASAAASRVNHWKLNAIWWQTGSRLAAINQGVYAEGDLIDGCRIVQIDSDRVWLQSPTGRESLGFTNPQPPSAAPAETNGASH